MLISAAQMAVDLNQLVEKKEGAQAELTGDLAGIAVGAAMVRARWNGDVKEAQTLIRAILCMK